MNSDGQKNTALTPEWQDLLRAALAVRQQAYAPYSRFKVGAAVRAASGRIYAGCNVENASLGLTVCAERAAIFQAVAAGERQLAALAVVTDVGAMPCGACRQVLSEFAAEMPILVGDGAGGSVFTSLAKLLPHRFSGSQLPIGSPVE